MGAPPGIDHRNCRSRVALAQCVLGCRKSDLEGPVEGTPEALRRRARAARRNRPPTGPQSAGRGGDRCSSGHHLGVVPKICRSQIRWMTYASSPGQSAYWQRHRGPDRSDGCEICNEHPLVPKWSYGIHCDQAPLAARFDSSIRERCTGMWPSSRPTQTVLCGEASGIKAAR